MEYRRYIEFKGTFGELFSSTFEKNKFHAFELTTLTALNSQTPPNLKMVVTFLMFELETC